MLKNPHDAAVTRLWSDGAVSCQVLGQGEPRYLTVSREGEDLVEVTIFSDLEARERANEWREIVYSGLLRR